MGVVIEMLAIKKYYAKHYNSCNSLLVYKHSKNKYWVEVVDGKNCMVEKNFFNKKTVKSFIESFTNTLGKDNIHIEVEFE